MRDLHLLPKVRDSLSFLYVEHAKIEQDDKSIAIVDVRGSTPVPCAAVSTLLLGPGTTISHAAVHTLSESGCLVLWTGEGGVRVYAQGLGETRSSRWLLQQARLWADAESHMRVVRRMYEMRFSGVIPKGDTLEQLRGREGVRVRSTYQSLSRATGVTWAGRSYRRGDWNAADPLNRALSAGNACLYGICHSAILSVGCSPAIGFIHTGRLLSFVYDVADLYKSTFTIPAAFAVVAESTEDVERRVRHLVRDTAFDGELMRRIVPDLRRILELDGVDEEDASGVVSADPDTEDIPPGALWEPKRDVEGGVNYGDGVEDVDGRDGS